MSEALQTTKDTYALIAETFASYVPSDSALEPDLAFLAAAVPGGIVADVGCGPGVHTQWLRDRGLRAIGLDLSDAMLRAGKLTSGLAQADMRALPLRTGSLDGIWSMAAFLHIPRAYARPVLSEFARAVRPGGALMLAVAEGDAEGYEVASNYGSEARRWFTYHRLEPLSELLAEAGFSVLAHRRWSLPHRDWLALHATRHPPRSG